MAQVLIIEDDNDFRSVLKDILERKNYTVETAEDGSEGLEMYRNNPSDIVIVDMIMPYKSGLQTVLELKEEDPELNIITISGSRNEIVEKYPDLKEVFKPEHTLRKPFGAEELLVLIKEFIS